MLDFGFYNIDCMKGMQEFPDKYFELAIVDPPYKAPHVKSLCWKCGKTGHNLCSWDRELRLGPGMKATRCKTREGERTIITKCPYFVGTELPYEPMGINALCNAIIELACKDYREAWHGYLHTEDGRRKFEHWEAIIEVERFFESPWVNELTRLKPSVLLEMLQTDIFKEEINDERKIRTLGRVETRDERPPAHRHTGSCRRKRKTPIQF